MDFLITSRWIGNPIQRRDCLGFRQLIGTKADVDLYNIVRKTVNTIDIVFGRCELGSSVQGRDESNCQPSNNGEKHS